MTALARLKRRMERNKRLASLIAMQNSLNETLRKMAVMRSVFGITGEEWLERHSYQVTLGSEGERA